MTIPEIVGKDLITALKARQPAYEIADIIAALFEFTENDQFKLWQVTEELYKFAMTPLEVENPFYPK